MNFISKLYTQWPMNHDIPSVIYAQWAKRFNANVQKMCSWTLKLFQQILH